MSNMFKKKIRRNIGVLKRLRNVIPRNALIILYKTPIEPHLRYCNIVGGGGGGYCNETLIQVLQDLQNRASRVITLVNTNALTTANYLKGSTGCIYTS